MMDDDYFPTTDEWQGHAYDTKPIRWYIWAQYFLYGWYTWRFKKICLSVPEGERG